MARKRRRSSSFAGGTSSGAGTVFYVMGAIVAVGLLGFGFYLMNTTKAEMSADAETLCPISGPVAETVVLFDVTDPLDRTQSEQLLQYLEREFAESAVGTQFTMGIVSEDSGKWGATQALCKPRSGQEVSALTQNVDMVKKRYEERFLAPLHDNLAKMMMASGSNTSPIMEALQALVADTPGFLTFKGPRKVIMVSDLLQHSDAMSFYKGDDWQSFAVSPSYSSLGRTLDGVAIQIYQMPRVVDRIEDPAVIEDFWIRYFDQQGADLPRVSKLGGL